MKDNNLFIIILIIIIGVILLNNSELFASLNERFPSEIFYEKEFGLSDSGSLTLPEGMKYENVRKIEILVIGCGEEKGDLILNDNNIGSYSFTDCEFLTYPDGSGKAYTHYQTNVFTKLFYGSPTSPLLASNIINYQFTRIDENIKAKKMIVYEKVECIVNSQCVQSAPFCDAVQHICLPKVTSCTMEWAPVCGDNGISYGNMCYSSMVGVSVVSNGLCPGDSATEVKDEKNQQIDFETIITPDTKTPSLYIWIGVFIIVIIILYSIRKK